MLHGYSLLLFPIYTTHDYSTRLLPTPIPHDYFSRLLLTTIPHDYLSLLLQEHVYFAGSNEITITDHGPRL